MRALKNFPVLGLVLVVLFWAAAAWRLTELQRPADRGDLVVGEDQALFEQALTAGLLVAGPNGELRPLPRDEMLAREQAGGGVDPQAKRLFSRLYRTQAGVAVRAELRRWNRTRSLAAVRDNSAGIDGLEHSGWVAYDCDGSQRALGGVVPEAYGFLHQGRLQAGFGPWQVAAGSGCVEFRSQFFAPRPTTFEVWLVGQPQDLRAAMTVTPLKPPRPTGCGRGTALLNAAKMVIPDSGWKRLAEPRAGAAWQRELRIRLRPVRYDGERIAGVKLAIDPHSCRHVWLDDAARGRRLAGRVPSRSAPLLRSADGVELLREDGRPAAAVRSLGLLPLVGYGRGDFHSLASLLARSRLPAGFETRLTLDSRLQRVAQQLLREGVDELFPLDTDRYALQRRAAMVVLNGRSGAILAVAGLPQAPQQGHLEDWDLAAFARRYPAQDPLRVRAWDSVLDKHNAPGSTMKPATALAALGKADSDGRVAGMLTGWGPRVFTRETGLGIAATRYDPYAGTAAGSPDGRTRTLKNFRLSNGRYESFQTLLDNRQLNAAECPRQVDLIRPLALPSAVRDSLNVWFARLAIMVDGAVMDQLDARLAADPRSRFTQTLQVLGFDRPLDLLAAAPEFIARTGRPQLPPAQVSLWAANPRPARWVLAQNAIGQGVSVAALHMARVAASIAAGRVVQPHLVQAWDGQLVIPVAGPLLPGNLDLLRAGMRAVPQVGTAKQAFAKVFKDRPGSPLRCSTYGKTGTAEVPPDPPPNGGSADSDRSHNSAWFIGWHQPAQGDPLAFACMVTHAHGRGHKTGGQVCAPIVARFLDRIFPPDQSGDDQAADDQAADSEAGR